MATRLRSYAKINLGLAIGGTRADGFHALATVYQTIGLHDVVTLSAEPAKVTQIAMASNHRGVPTDERNTAWRMVTTALEAMGVAARVTIHIDKQLPVQGGLGAGSANAAAALIALERELSRYPEMPGLTAGEKLRVAAQVGSDVPLFLIGGTVLGLGRGEQVFPLPDLPATPCVIATPDVQVSTPQAFRDWDGLHATSSGFSSKLSLVPAGGHASLTGRNPSDTLDRLSRAIAGVWSGPNSSGVSAFDGRVGDLAGNPLLALVRTGIENDFERVVFPQYPFLGDIKRVIENSGGPDEEALFASLSGSGASLFGLYRSEAAALGVQERLAGIGVPGRMTELLTRDRYWCEMIEE